MEQQFRTTSSRKEILDSLSVMHIEESPVIIWQNIDGRRNVSKARIDYIDQASSTIILSPAIENDADLDDRAFKEMNSDFTLYFIGESKNIVFKQVKALKVISKKLLRVQIPDEVKLQEKRLENRIVFPNYMQTMTSEIRPGGQTNKSANATNVELRDISLSGMGINLSKKSANFFYIKDKIKIDRIGNYRFQRPIYGTIVYMSDSGLPTNQLKIGIRFNEKISQEILDKIK